MSNIFLKKNLLVHFPELINQKTKIKCFSGWEKLLTKMCFDIQKHVDETNHRFRRGLSRLQSNDDNDDIVLSWNYKEIPQPELLEIYSINNRLSVKISYLDPKIKRIIELAISESEKICQKCKSIKNNNHKCIKDIK